MRRYIFPVFIIILILIASCYYDNEEALYPSLDSFCDTTNVTFSLTIATIVNGNCTSCHSGSLPSGSITLTGYNNIQAVAANGSLMNALNGNGVPVMPPSGALAACKINQFRIWIRKGMLNN